jgi:AcrR family transcriptional regulator
MGVGKDVVNDQGAADGHPRRPAFEVPVGGGLAVTAIDEQQLQGGAPGACHHRRLPHHRHHRIVQTGIVEGAPEGGQGVEPSGSRIDQRGVVKLPSRLMFFRTVVVVDSEEDTFGGYGRRRQQQRGLAAVRADFHSDAVLKVLQRGVIQGLALAFGHEADDPIGQLEQLGSALGGLGHRRHPVNLAISAYRFDRPLEYSGSRVYCRRLSVVVVSRHVSDPVARESTRRRLTDKQAQTVDRLGRAAIQVLSREGFSGLTIRMVAAEAGVGAATAYTYFSSKEHLVAEVFWRRLASTPVPPSDAIDPGGRVVAVLRQIALLVADESELAGAVTTALLGDDPEVRQLRWRIGHEIHQRLVTASGPDCNADIIEALESIYAGALVRAGMGYASYTQIADRLEASARLLMR